MRIISLLVISLFLVSCGGGGGSKTKTYRKGMSDKNALIGQHGLGVKYYEGYVFVSCEDAKTTDVNTDNYDRARSLKEYKDSLRGMDFVEFVGGTRVDVWEVEFAIDQAITKLEKDLSGTSCPELILGQLKV